VKELNIVVEMLERKLKEDVERLTPIVINQPEELETVKVAMRETLEGLRREVAGVVEGVFLGCVKECEKNKKINSFIVFSNYWK
jgi:hypothetical protein